MSIGYYVIIVLWFPVIIVFKGFFECILLLISRVLLYKWLMCILNGIGDC